MICMSHFQESDICLGRDCCKIEYLDPVTHSFRLCIVVSAIHHVMVVFNFS